MSDKLEILKEYAEEMYEILKKKPGCQACIGNPMVRGHSDFCERSTHILKKIEEDYKILKKLDISDRI